MKFRKLFDTGFQHKLCINVLRNIVTQATRKKNSEFPQQESPSAHQSDAPLSYRRLVGAWPSSLILLRLVLYGKKCIIFCNRKITETTTWGRGGNREYKVREAGQGTPGSGTRYGKRDKARETGQGTGSGTRYGKRDKVREAGQGTGSGTYK